MAETLPIEPAVLVWARETAGYSVETIADKLHIDRERLQSWESGEAQPGISHIRRLASIYKRPVPALFLAKPPEEPPQLTDFRTIESRAAGLSPETRFAIRNARRWQEICSDIADDQGLLESLSVPRLHFAHDQELFASRMRDWLDAGADFHTRWSDAREGFNGWRRAIEEHNVLVFALPVPRDDCRGFSLWEEGDLPVIVVNSQEVPEARSFTLLHELCHLMLRNAGLCDQVESGHPERQVEAFCNRTAGFALIPKELLVDVVSDSRDRGNEYSPRELIDVVRRRFRTSRHVAALRLEADGHITSGTYESLNTTWSDEDWRPSGGGGQVRYRYRILGEKGRLYSTILIGAWKDGALSSLEASRLMEVKTSYLTEVASELGL